MTRISKTSGVSKVNAVTSVRLLPLPEVPEGRKREILVDYLMTNSLRSRF